MVAETCRVNPGALEYYWRIFPQTSRLISSLDREPDSVSYGSFDREHWSWKFRDYPINMLQVAIYPLAILWAIQFPDNPYYKNARLFDWILGALESTLHRQHSNGAYDSVGPNTQDYGVTLAVVYCLTESLRFLNGSISVDLVAAIKKAVVRSCKFALEHNEDYAFITNHQALFAVAFLNAYNLIGDVAYQQESERIIREILANQSSDGWYLEYEGADPGYESLGLFYLAVYWQRTGDAELLHSIKRSLEFYANCIHPDGSVGGNYGSRHTTLYYPGGFEILSGVSPLAAKIAEFLRCRLDRQNVVTPQNSDIENLPSLAYTYLEACFFPETEKTTDLPSLPCENLDGMRSFPASGIIFFGANNYYAVFNASKGGVCRIYDKQSELIAYEDAGYILHALGRRWSSQSIGMGNILEKPGENALVCGTRFVEVNQELLTPGKFVILRLLNLTLFRSQILGRWLRKLIISRLITNKRPGPMRLTRRIEMEDDCIHVHDRIDIDQPVKIDQICLPRAFTSIHMGSSKYFHPSELVPIPQVPIGGLVESLNSLQNATCSFTLRFAAQEKPEQTTVNRSVDQDNKIEAREVK